MSSFQFYSIRWGNQFSQHKTSAVFVVMRPRCDCVCIHFPLFFLRLQAWSIRDDLQCNVKMWYGNAIRNSCSAFRWHTNYMEKHSVLRKVIATGSEDFNKALKFQQKLKLEEEAVSGQVSRPRIYRTYTLDELSPIVIDQKIFVNGSEAFEEVLDFADWRREYFLSLNCC